MVDLETPVLRPVVWMGSSKRNLRAFPVGAQKLIGDELQLIQYGGMPREVGPFRRNRGKALAHHNGILI